MQRKISHISEGNVEVTKRQVLKKRKTIPIKKLERMFKKEIQRILQTPEKYICPIGKEIFKDPVLTVDGIAYEREQIEKWLAKHNTSPCTNIVLSNKQLVPAIHLKNDVEEYKRQVIQEGLECIKERLEENDFNNAFKLIERVKEFDETNLNVLNLEIQYYHQKGDIHQKCEALFQLGTVLLQLGQFDEASITFSNIIKEVPKDMLVEKVCQIFESGITLVPFNDTQNLMNLTCICVKELKTHNHINEAKTVLLQCRNQLNSFLEYQRLKLEVFTPNEIEYVEACTKIADIKLSQDDIKEAVEWIDKAIQLNGNYLPAYEVKAEIYEKLKDRSKLSTLLLEVATVFEEKNHHELSEKYYRKLYELDPNLEAGKNGLIRVLSILGKTNELEMIMLQNLTKDQFIAQTISKMRQTYCAQIENLTEKLNKLHDGLVWINNCDPMKRLPSTIYLSAANVTNPICIKWDFNLFNLKWRFFIQDNNEHKSCYVYLLSDCLNNYDVEVKTKVQLMNGNRIVKECIGCKKFKSMSSGWGWLHFCTKEEFYKAFKLSKAKLFRITIQIMDVQQKEEPNEIIISIEINLIKYKTE